MGEDIVNVYGSLASIDCQASAVTYGVSTTYKGIRTPVTRKKYLMHVKTGKVMMFYQSRTAIVAIGIKPRIINKTKP